MHEAERNDRTLRRIIATLVALAVLAERAAGRSVPVRWFVLALLRYAERAAWGFVTEATGWDWSDLDDAFATNSVNDPDRPLGSGNGPADALALAWRLRALATVLRALLSPDDRPFGETAPVDCVRARADGAARHLARRLPVTSGGWPHLAPDTS